MREEMEPKVKAKPEEDMSCLLAMMIPTELVTFIAHAPTFDTPDAFFSLSPFSISSSFILLPPVSDPGGR